jgi:ABC-type nitrate/sulfonate/bicarbonate transport system ATPase subunit
MGMESLPAMIELHDVSFGYRHGKRIFDNFSWNAGRGEAWAILGSSGCGKSTLLYLLAGLLRPDTGTLRIAGDALERPRPRTGLILQDYGLLPWATVRDNIALGLRVRQFYGPDGRHAPQDEVITQVEERVTSWLDQMGLAEVAESFPGQISGGQRQRTAIARTLALNPDLLLMDEPFASLDAPTREALQQFVINLNAERGLTTVVVTHSIEEAALLGRRVLVLGMPPNRQAHFIECPAVKTGSAGYQELIDQLRQMLGAAI